MKTYTLAEAEKEWKEDDLTLSKLSRKKRLKKLRRRRRNLK